jgi:hypothetical protein
MSLWTCVKTDYKGYFNTAVLSIDFARVTHGDESLILDIRAVVCHELHSLDLATVIRHQPIIRLPSASQSRSQSHSHCMTHFLARSPPYCKNLPTSCTPTLSTSGSRVPLSREISCLCEREEVQGERMTCKMSERIQCLLDSLSTTLGTETFSVLLPEVFRLVHR